jgi:preprotein translocase subunit SecF
MIAFQNALGTVLSTNFKGNTFTRGEANTVNSSLAGEALVKIIVTVVLAALLIVAYIAIRFRKVGGVSAAIASLIALVHDIIIAFFACAIFGLDIDANFFAVALTLFGYSINATIVIFDRIRENKKYYSGLTIRECANRSINETLARSIMTSISTFASIVAIVVIAELFGVTSLRSFAIPMGIGVIAGCFSSIFVAGPLWIKWKEFKASKKSKNS